MSTKIGFAPVETIEFAVATKEKDGRSTSSPFLISNVYNAACNAAVPELTAIAYFAFTNEVTFFSKTWTYFPPSLAEEVRTPFFSIELTTEISSFPIIGEFIVIFDCFLCMIRRNYSHIHEFLYFKILQTA